MNQNKKRGFRLLIQRIREGQGKKYMFLRFAFVGVINTVHNYIWYILFLALNIPYMASFTVAFIISMIGSFFLNCYFTFKTKPTLSKFIKFPLTTLANYCISTVTLFILVNIVTISPFVAGPLASLLPIPITFLMTKLLLKDDGVKLNISKKIIYIAIIIMIFLAIAVISHGRYIFSTRIFVNNQTDSMEQFMYFIPFIEKSLSEGNIMWSWSYGLGGDVLSEFSYYYTTSPFFYLLYFVRRILGITINYARTIDLKLCLSIFKQFLIMISMYSLLRYEGKKKYTSFIGAITYGVTIIFMRNAVAFDYMTDAMIWLPITILGYQIREKTKKNSILILGITLTIVNSFYFAYMSLIFYCIYAIIFTTGEGENFKNKLGSYIKKGIQYGLKITLSLGIAAFLFIPSVIAFMQSDRFEEVFIIPKLFPELFYKSLFENIFLYNNIVAIPLVALLVFALPFKRISSETRKKTVMSAIFFIMFLIPMAYSMFNGFSYTTDRWIYILNFVVAYSIPNWIEECDFRKYRGIKAIISLVIFMIIIICTRKVRVGTEMQRAEYIIIFIGILSIILLYIRELLKNIYMKKIVEYLVCICVLVGLVGNLYKNITIVYTEDYDVVSSKLQRMGMDNDLEREILHKTIPETNEFYRTIYELDYKENTPMNYMNYGASAYNSLINKNIHRWMKLDYNVIQLNVSPSRFANFNNRLFLESAFGVRYKLLYNDNVVPYGYEVSDVNDKYILYQNNNTVGFDLWYNNYESIDRLQELNYAERDALLLNTALLNKDIDGIRKGDLNFDTINKVDIDFDNAELINARYEGGKLYVDKDAEISMPIKNTHNYQYGEILFTANIQEYDGKRFTIAVDGKNSHKGAKGEKWVYPLDEFTYKLDGDISEIKVILSPGVYIVNEAVAYYSSYDKYDQWVSNVNKYNIENLVVDGPYVAGNITNNEKGILALSIPYNKGWTAKVDNKDVELLRVNGIFTGIELEPGEHKLELNYITPGLKVGSAISISSLFICLLWYFISKRKLKISSDS